MSNTKRGCISDQEQQKIETAAQLFAIKKSIIDGMKIFPHDIPVLWSEIYAAHLHKKSGISNLETIENVISAAQSWKASSGHAFEEMVKDLGTLAMQGTGIQAFVSFYKKDLNVLLKANELANGPTDLAWLRQQVRGAVFDLYVVAECKVVNEETNEVETKSKCFGCVQCKTSIRDRVSRDREPSVEAMEAKFRSITFILDGTMLSTPKYINMVNGNPMSEFKKNGWHGAYVISAEEDNDRIYAVDVGFDVVRCHTINAFNAWKTDRQGYSRD